MIAAGRIAKEVDGGFLVFVPCVNHREQVRNSDSRVYVEFRDPRKISREQQKKAYALIGEIARWWGYMPQEAAKELTKVKFLTGGAPVMLADTFSLADCTVEEARKYITWLIDFCLIYDVPMQDKPLYELVEDIPRYVYACLLNKRCAVCGKKSELHHVDHVGMGRDRREMCHIGMRCLPLCRHHHNEIHTIGAETFLKRYILEPVEIDRRIAEKYRLKAR